MLNRRVTLALDRHRNRPQANIVFRQRFSSLSLNWIRFVLICALASDWNAFDEPPLSRRLNLLWLLCWHLGLDVEQNGTDMIAVWTGADRARLDLVCWAQWPNYFVPVELIGIVEHLVFNRNLTLFETYFSIDQIDRQAWLFLWQSKLWNRKVVGCEDWIVRGLSVVWCFMLLLLLGNIWRLDCNSQAIVGHLSWMLNRTSLQLFCLNWTPLNLESSLLNWLINRFGSFGLNTWLLGWLLLRVFCDRRRFL